LSKRVEQVMEKYTQRDFEALRSIYDFRCLSMSQLFELHYKKSGNKEVTSEYLRKKIIKLKQDNLIEYSQSMNKSIPTVYFLTSDGIKAVKIYFNFPNNIYDTEKRIHERGYFTYSEIKIANRFIAHQHNLNEFALNGINLINENNITYSYFDERHVANTYGIRPDGVLSTLGLDLFLEMDMGTESINQLKEKWNHYRSYVNSQSYANNGKKVIILFICNNKGRINDRVNLIKNSINEHFIDCLKDKIEIYVGIPEKLISVIKNIIIPYYTTTTNDLLSELTKELQNKNYKIASGKQLSKYLNNVDYTFYIKNPINNKEFLVQEFFGEPMSSMNRVTFHDSINIYFKSKFNKDIPLILVGTSEDMLIKNLDIFQLESSNKVYYSTLKRLEIMPFNEAVFTITSNHVLYCFNEDFTETKPTEKLNKK